MKRFCNLSVPPSQVRVSGPSEGIRGEQLTVSCRSDASNPAVELGWLVDEVEHQAQESAVHSLPHGFYTISNLTVALSRQVNSTFFFPKQIFNFHSIILYDLDSFLYVFIGFFLPQFVIWDAKSAKVVATLNEVSFGILFLILYSRYPNSVFYLNLSFFFLETINIWMLYGSLSIRVQTLKT